MLEALMPVYGRDAGNFSVKPQLIGTRGTQFQVRIRLLLCPICAINLHARHKGQRGTSTNVRQQAIGCVATPVPVAILAVTCAKIRSAFYVVSCGTQTRRVLDNPCVAKPMLFYRDENNLA